MRRFIEEPERFEREFQTINRALAEKADGKEQSYGETCSAYMAELASDVPVA